MAETLGRYQLVKKLATGGMGQVFLARQKGPVGFEKMVVVKRILPHLTEEDEFIQMFFDEARIAALLNHPNIAQIYDLGEVDGTYYIAMEYVQGESLRSLNDRANEEGGLPLGLKCRVISDAAAGLDFAHHAKNPSGHLLGLIHRDVSPQNILVGYNGAVKLIDFGVAKAAGKISTTMTGAIKGKYAYMSPEQARGEELDQRSDVFGLGVVFYELLTSSRLFKRESETATLRAVVSGKVAPPSTVTKGIHKAVDQIVLKALAKKRTERFQSAGELQLAIEDFLVRQRLPATTAHLAAFMRDLFPEGSSVDRPYLADDGSNGLSGDSNGRVGEKTPSRSRGDGTQVDGDAPVRKRMSFDEIADERAVKATPVSAGKPRADASGSRKSGTGSKGANVVDIAELDLRIAGCAPADTTRGLFFNAVLAAVVRFAGPIAEPHVRNAAIDPRPYSDAFSYATSDFLRMLWKAAEVIAPMSSGVDQAFIELGAACMDALLRSSVGRTLEQLSGEGDAQWLLTPLLATLQPMVSPGERRIEASGGRGATLVISGDMLPPQFYLGFFAHAFARLRNVVAKTSFDKRGPDAVALKLGW